MKRRTRYSREKLSHLLMKLGGTNNEVHLDKKRTLLKIEWVITSPDQFRIVVVCCCWLVESIKEEKKTKYLTNEKMQIEGSYHHPLDLGEYV